MYSNYIIKRVRKERDVAHIRELAEDKVVAVAHLGYKTGGSIVKKTKTLDRPKNVSKSRWLKSSYISVVTKRKEDLLSEKEKHKEKDEDM